MAVADRLKAIERRLDQVEATLATLLAVLEDEAAQDEAAEVLTSLDGEQLGSERNQSEGL